ncbi:MAG: threonine synthase [Spirochaetaceae bacterium]|nr:MAG: threonine synthase [Spirochaetaceae bacterium]
MIFASTRTPTDRVTFAEGIFRGLAPDGGLYHPVSHPDLSNVIGDMNAATSFAELAGEVVFALLHDELSRSDAEQITRRAFPFSPAIVSLGPRLQLLELFHGPSCAFKDFGASFLAACMEHFLGARDRRAVILTATSGDTGSAVAQAFHGVHNIEVVILYPSGRVSPLQEKQLTTVGGNVHAVEVHGSFDDCQRMVKEAFVDQRLTSGLSLTSANSINLGRLLPQSFYYLHAAVQMAPARPVFCVPSGNFGNLTAGVLAWKWGMAACRFLATTNANDVVPHYLATGEFAPRPSVPTLSNAMDVGNPSNFERLAALFDHDVTQMRAQIEGASIADADTSATIARYHREQRMFLCPHTATGVLAAERYRDRHTDASADHPILCLATAHPGKFLEVVQEATGEQPPLPPQLAEALARPKVAVPMANQLEPLREFLLDSF